MTDVARGDGPFSLHCEPEHGCITCSDEAVALRVLRVDAARDLALCEAESGEHTTVEIALVAPVGPGDGVLVHAGTAIARVAPEEVAG